MTNTVDAAVCEYCGKPRALAERGFGTMTFSYYKPCDCARAVEERAKAEERERREKADERRRELARLYDLAGIPPEHRRYDHPLSAELAETVKTGRGLYIVGEVGRKKTTLACAIARRLIAGGLRRVRFLPAVDLPSMIRATYRRGAEETEDDLVGKYAGCNLLVLDDLGKGKSTDFGVGVLFQIIDRRTRELLPTIVTSQYERDKLAEWMGRSVDRETAESLASRLAGHCDRVLLEGDDMRLSGRAAS